MLARFLRSAAKSKARVAGLTVLTPSSSSLSEGSSSEPDSDSGSERAPGELGREKKWGFWGVSISKIESGGVFDVDDTSVTSESERARPRESVRVTFTDGVLTTSELIWDVERRDGTRGREAESNTDFLGRPRLLVLREGRDGTIGTLIRNRRAFVKSRR
jgi:hypothetical protein